MSCKSSLSCPLLFFSFFFFWNPPKILFSATLHSTQRRSWRGSHTFALFVFLLLLFLFSFPHCLIIHSRSTSQVID
jgi:hypothetical protein